MSKLKFIVITLLIIATINPSCKQKAKEEIIVESEQLSAELKDLNDKIEKNPEDHKLFERRAKLHLSEGRPYEALSDISQALQLDPQNTNYTIFLADIYFSMGNIENARKSLITAQDNDPTNTEPVLKLAELNFILKDYEKMNLYINRVLEIDKSNAKAWLIRGMAHKEQGEKDKALRAIKESTMLDPEYYEAFVEAGILSLELKSPLTVDYLTHAINLRPQKMDARYALAMYYQEIGKLNEAIQEYYTMISIDKNFVHAHFNLGYIHLVELQLYDQAIGHFNTAIQINPRFAEAWYNRGYCFELKGDVENARRNYQEALSLKTNYKMAIDGLNRIENLLNR